jgi:hypothetical protein
MKNISRRIFILLFPAFCFLASCAAHHSQVRPSALGSDPRTRGEGKFDPLSDPGDKDIITTDVPVAPRSQQQTGTIDMTNRNLSESKKSVPLFAVQVFASKSSTDARDFKSSIEKLFREETRVDYQAPYYRVVIGKAEGLDEADALLKMVKDQGFPEAWLVRLRK